MQYTLGKYKLVRKLAQGGMASVWLAREQGEVGLRRLVVLKHILPHLAGSREFQAMFTDEARIIAQLRHPNIVHVFELEYGEQFFIAMELILGETLSDLQRASKARGMRIPLSIICRLIADACKGLHHAHTQTSPEGRPLGIVHRDMTPHNIMVTYEGQVKIVDFGIAKAADRVARTVKGVVKGKYRYMSPEQVRGADLDRRSDVFSLGNILFELCTGRRLFEAEEEGALILQLAECKIPRPRDVDPKIPLELENIILKALATDRDVRYFDAQELRLALENFAKIADLMCSTDDVAQFVRGLCRERMLEKNRIVADAYFGRHTADEEERELDPATDRERAALLGADEITASEVLDHPTLPPFAGISEELEPIRPEIYEDDHPTELFDEHPARPADPDSDDGPEMTAVDMGSPEVTVPEAEARRSTSEAGAHEVTAPEAQAQPARPFDAREVTSPETEAMPARPPPPVTREVTAPEAHARAVTAPQPPSPDVTSPFVRTPEATEVTSPEAVAHDPSMTDALAWLSDISAEEVKARLGLVEPTPTTAPPPGPSPPAPAPVHPKASSPAPASVVVPVHASPEPVQEDSRWLPRIALIAAIAAAAAVLIVWMMLAAEPR